MSGSVVADHELVGLLESVLEFDARCADAEQVKVVVSDVTRLMGRLEVVRVSCRRRLDQLQAASSSSAASSHGTGTGCAGGVSAESEMADSCGRSAGAARDAAERARVLDLFPPCEALLAAGSLSIEHIDVLAKLTRNLTDRERSDLIARTDEVIAAAAGYVTSLTERVKSILGEIQLSHRERDAVAELERQRARASVKRWRDRATGMEKLFAELDPVRAARLDAALNGWFKTLRARPENADRPSREIEVEALMAALTGDPPRARSGSDGGGAGASGPDDVVFAEGEPRDEEAVGRIDRRPDISVIVDARSLRDGRHRSTTCESVDGVELPIETVREMACDARLTAVILDADGVVRRLGKEVRTANRSQRRALAAMYRTCAHPDCAVPFSRCRIHHVVWYSKGGATRISNLLPLCERHHHMVHEGGWNLTIDPGRVVTWYRPDGSVWWQGDARNRQSTTSTDDGLHSKPVTVGRDSPGPSETWQQPQLC